MHLYEDQTKVTWLDAVNECSYIRQNKFYIFTFVNIKGQDSKETISENE